MPTDCTEQMIDHQQAWSDSEACAAPYWTIPVKDLLVASDGPPLGVATRGPRPAADVPFEKGPLVVDI